jgi:hypothetical protein
VRGHETGRKPADRTLNHQLALFTAEDQPGEDPHLRKLYRHRK